MIQAEVPDGLLTMYLSGKVTSANAETLKAEAVSAIEQSGYKSVEIDAENLEYISSAGLRVLLTLQKQYGMKTIRNA